MNKNQLADAAYDLMRTENALSQSRRITETYRAALVKVREQIKDVECESNADSDAVGRCIDTIEAALEKASL